VTAPFVIERLSPAHDRRGFSCGVERLDLYLAPQASQDVRKRAANCFVAIARDTGTIAGYYTLSASGLAFSELPFEFRKSLPRYDIVPAALIGRLAVDLRFRGARLGEALIFDAVDRALVSDPAIFAIVVDAKDEGAASFYRHYEFQPTVTRPLTLFLPVSFFAKRPRPKDSP